MNERKFKGTGMQMLLATRLIIENAIGMADKLAAVRPKWTLSYLTDIRGNITGILEDNFGIDATASLKEVTANLIIKEAAAKTALQQVKTQVEVDFGKDKTTCDHYLTVLGLNKVKSIKNASQDATIEMLVAFTTNLTPAIEADLTAAGLPPATIATIKTLSTELYQINTIQEKAKVGSKETTATLNTQLNAVYDEVISIAKIASSLLTEKLDIEKFSYTRALKQMGHHPSKKKKPTPPIKD
jgi:hypothetical protein